MHCYRLKQLVSSITNGTIYWLNILHGLVGQITLLLNMLFKYLITMNATRLLLQDEKQPRKGRTKSKKVRAHHYNNIGMLCSLNHIGLNLPSKKEE